MRRREALWHQAAYDVYRLQGKTRRQQRKLVGRALAEAAKAARQAVMAARVFFDVAEFHVSEQRSAIRDAEFKEAQERLGKKQAKRKQQRRREMQQWQERKQELEKCVVLVLAQAGRPRGQG